MKKLIILFVGFCLIFCITNVVKAQDQCSTAVDITASLTATCNNIPGPFAFAATPGSLEDACGAASAPTDAIWLTFIAPLTGLLDVTNTENPGTPDTQVSILEGGCGAQMCLLLDDDGGNGFTSAAMGVPVVAGNQYWIEWTDGYGGAPEFFDVRIVEIFPPVATNVQDVSAEVDLAGACAGAVVEYGAPGFAEGTGTDGSSGSLSGLTSETEYEVCVSCGDPALCGFTGITSGDESSSRVCSTFTTFASCDPLAVEAVADGTVCPGDPFTLDATLSDVIPGAFIDYTVTPAAAGSCTAVPDNPADCVDLGLGDDGGSGPIPLGFSFDFFGTTYTDVCVGSNGYVTFTCVDETDFSDDPIPTATDPNAIVALFWDDLNPTDAISGIVCTYPATIGGQTCFVADYQNIAHFGGGETVTGQIIICPDNTVTINCIDCQSDGGADNATQGIEDETGATGAFDPAFPDGVVPGAATTSNCVTFTPNTTPDSACDFVAWVTDPNNVAGTTVSTTNPFDVNPMSTTTYYAVVDCDGLTCSDDVVVTIDDPANCTVCQGIDLAAGLPVIPTEVCSGATADICLTLIDAAEGLVITGSIDGAPVTLTGVAGAGANELCVTITAPVNETCAPADVNIEIDAIQCTDGTDYPGILGGATLIDDLNTAGLNPIAIPVYPTLAVTATGDGMCGDLVAELVAMDGTVCATAAGSPLTCAANGDALAYDFTGDPALADFTAVPADCSLPTLSGTLTCANCTVMGCTDPCAPNYDPAAGVDDGSCMPYDDTCNADCTMGPFGGTWDPVACACMDETTPINGCTDAAADNYDPAANCDDGSCVTTNPVDIAITDPCNCTQGIDLDMDGINDLAQETITITPGTPPYMVGTFTGNLYDSSGNPIATNMDLMNLISGNTLVFYVDADGSSTYSVTITDSAGQSDMVMGGPCDVCSPVNNIPTVGEWGLIILGLLMSITAVVGIRQRREEEVYS